MPGPRSPNPPAALRPTTYYISPCFPSPCPSHPPPVSWLQVCSTAKLLWPSEQFQTRKSNSRNPPSLLCNHDRPTAQTERDHNFVGKPVTSGEKYLRPADAPSASLHPLTIVTHVFTCRRVRLVIRCRKCACGITTGITRLQINLRVVSGWRV